MSYRDAVLATSGLVSYWRLGETSGTSAADSFGTNTGTYINTPTLGVTGALSGSTNTAVTFTAASSEYVDVPNIAPGTNASWEFWIKGASGAAGWGVALRNSSTSAYLAIGFNGGRLTAESYSGASFTFLDGPFGKDDNNWHHVVLTKTGTALALYVDGSTSWSATLPAALSTDTLNLGRLPNGTAYLNGSLDEVAIYSVALSGATISAHYAAAGDPETAPPPPGGGKHLIKSARVIIDAIDASSLAHSVSVEKSVEDIDITSYASVAGYKEFLFAERVENFQVAFRVDTAQALPRALRDAQAQGSTVFVEVLPTSAANSTTNPAWAADCVVGALTLLDAPVGDAAGSEVELRSTGDVFEYTTTPTILSPLTLLGPSTVLAS